MRWSDNNVACTRQMRFTSHRIRGPLESFLHCSSGGCAKCFGVLYKSTTILLAFLVQFKISGDDYSKLRHRILNGFDE